MQRLNGGKKKQSNQKACYKYIEHIDLKLP